MRAQTICGVPGCSTVGPCPQHSVKRSGWPTVSRHKRGYDSEHVRLRHQVLKEEPLCRYCGAPSTSLDHIVPKSQGGGNERHNLAGCCARCQKRKAGRESNAARLSL